MLKNITLSAEEELINKARDKANKERTTLNALFREWLIQYANKDQKIFYYNKFMEMWGYADPGGPITREKINER